MMFLFKMLLPAVFFLVGHLAFSQEQNSSRKIKSVQDNKLLQIESKINFLKSLENKKLISPYLDFYQIKLFFLKKNFKDMQKYVRNFSRISALAKDPHFASELYFYLINLAVYNKDIRKLKYYMKKLLKLRVGSSFEQKTLSLAAFFLKGRDESKLYFDLLEELSLTYPFDRTASEAFKNLLQEANLEDLSPDKKKIKYYFSYRYLVRLARWINYEPGLREFLFLIKDLKIRKNKKKEAYLSPFEKLEFLKAVRLYKRAFDFGKELLKENSGNLKRSKQIYLIMGETASRLEKNKEAIYYFSLYRRYEKNKFRWKKLGQNSLAFSLERAGLEQESLKLRSKMLWLKNDLRPHVEYTLDAVRYKQWEYVKKRTSAFIKKGKNRKIRNSLYKSGIYYWQGKSAEALKTPSESSYQKVLSHSCYSYYAILSSFKTVNKKKKLIKKEGKIVLSFFENEKKEPPDSFLMLINRLLAADLKKVVRSLLNNKSKTRRSSLKNISYLPSSEKAEAYWFKIKTIQKLFTYFDSSFCTSNLSNLAEKSVQKKIWKAYYPRVFEEHNLEKISGVDPLLLYSLIRAESRYQKQAKSYVGAVGLMQIMPYTAFKIANRLGDNKFDIGQLWEPRKNLSYGIWYLGKLLAYYKKNYILAVAAYNAGPDAVDRWLRYCQTCDTDLFIESIPYKETRNYVKKIVLNYYRYLSLYKKPPNFSSLLPSLPEKFSPSQKLF